MNERVCVCVCILLLNIFLSIYFVYINIIFKPGGTLSGGALTGAPTTKVSQHEMEMHNQLELEAAAQRVLLSQ